MAGEQRRQRANTEDPTPKRLDEAIRRGDVVKSAEVSTWFMHRRRHADAHGVRGAGGGEPASDVSRPSRQFPSDSDRRSGAGGAGAEARGRRSAVALGVPLLLLCARRASPATPSSIASCSRPSRSCRNCREISPAAGLKRLFSAQALANFAKGLAKLAVVRRGDGGAAVAAARPPRRHCRRRSGGDPAVHTVARDADARHGGGDPRHHRRRRLPVPVPAMVRAAENVAAGNEGGVPPDRGRSGHQGQAAADCAPRARASA